MSIFFTDLSYIAYILSALAADRCRAVKVQILRGDEVAGVEGCASDVSQREAILVDISMFHPQSGRADSTVMCTMFGNLKAIGNKGPGWCGTKFKMRTHGGGAELNVKCYMQYWNVLKQRCANMKWNGSRQNLRCWTLLDGARSDIRDATSALYDSAGEVAFKCPCCLLDSKADYGKLFDQFNSNQEVRHHKDGDCGETSLCGAGALSREAGLEGCGSVHQGGVQCQLWIAGPYAILIFV